MGLDEIERKVELLERTMDEIERLSRAMVAGMHAHYSQAPRDHIGEDSKGGD